MHFQIAAAAVPSATVQWHETHGGTEDAKFELKVGNVTKAAAQYLDWNTYQNGNSHEITLHYFMWEYQKYSTSHFLAIIHLNILWYSLLQCHSYEQVGISEMFVFEIACWDSSHFCTPAGF